MRADYGLYVLAIMCFIIAGLVSLETVPQYLPKLETFGGTFTTVIFTALGLIFVIVGYSLRPKPIISIPEAPKPALQPSTKTPPTPPQEETVKPEMKKPKAKTRRKRTKRRRKKA